MRILSRLRQHHLLAANLCAPAEHIVGTFEGFDGNNSSLGCDDGLADIEPGHLAGHALTELELIIADAASPASHATRRGEVIVEKDTCIEHADADFFDLDGDGAEDCLSVPFLKGGHQRDEL